MYILRENIDKLCYCESNSLRIHLLSVGLTLLLTYRSVPRELWSPLNWHNSICFFTMRNHDMPGLENLAYLILGHVACTLLYKYRAETGGCSQFVVIG